SNTVTDILNRSICRGARTLLPMDYLSLPFFDSHHRDLARDLDSWARSHLPEQEPEVVADACKKLVRKLGEAGWTKLCVPAPAGRFGKLDVRSLCITRETLAYHSALADFAFAMQGLGSGPISLFGSDEQRGHYLPRVASGEAIAAFALSEADAGSDVAALATTATPDEDGFVINGSKTWISNAGIADFYVVFARTGEGDGYLGLSAFLVDADTPGLTVTEQIDTISPHPLGALEFTDCRVPRSALLGEAGKGFKIAMATLDVFRSTVGAAALGMARRAFDETVRHVKHREVFGGTLADLQITQAKIAEMATLIDATALLVYRAAWTKDNGAKRITREAAMAKGYATESAQKVIDMAVQLFGGRGVTAGHIVERLYRDIRPLRIYEGATEIQQVVIARQVLRDA
ncbi:MAG: acyl-CoA dehydrogenase family protein, partial [Rubricoccaceae bacterium]|nr:acyl-CoA dehydrogenase family protein [Rubricoccaceae bacterium]